jgi:hypothetical protein
MTKDVSLIRKHLHASLRRLIMLTVAIDLLSIALPFQ